MGVRVEVPVDQDHLQDRRRTAIGEDLPVEPGAFDEREILPRHAFDELLHVHRRRRELPVDPRDHDRRIVGEIAREAVLVTGLLLEVQFATQ